MLKFWIVTAKVQDPNIGSREALLLRWGLISNGDGISDYLSNKYISFGGKYGDFKLAGIGAERKMTCISDLLIV